MFETEQNADVQELVLRETPQVIEYSAFRYVHERGRGGREVNRSDEFVYTRIKQGVCGPVNGVDVGFRVPLEVYQLWEKSRACETSGGMTAYCTYLRPSDVRRDDEFDVPMSEDTQDHLPQIPLMQSTTALE